MTSRMRIAALAIAAATGLLVAPLALAASASAAVPSQAKILFFSNDSYTDPDEEDATQIAVLEETGATVTVFDGGDGTGEAWAAALEGQDVLVIPESTEIYLTAVFDADAANVLYDFVFNGGRVILPTIYQPQLLSFLTALDYTSVWGTTDSSAPGVLQVDDPSLPATVTYSNGTYPVISFDTWSAELTAAVTPLYTDETGTLLHAAQWTVGSGTISVLAYDWYPGDEPEDIAGRALWNQLLQALTNVPVPQLAATGSEVTVAPALAAFGLLLLGAVVVVGTRVRRTARA